MVICARHSNPFPHVSVAVDSIHCWSVLVGEHVVYVVVVYLLLLVVVIASREQLSHLALSVQPVGQLGTLFVVGQQYLCVVNVQSQVVALHVTQSPKASAAIAACCVANGIAMPITTIADR